MTITSQVLSEVVFFLTIFHNYLYNLTNYIKWRENNMFKRKRSLIAIIFIISALLLVACVNDTSFEGSNNFAEASEVAEVYLETSENVKIIDARGEEAYAKGHLKNSICISPSELVVEEPVKATVAPKEQVEEILGNSGINKDTMVYIYDDNGGVYAGRIWWTLKLYGHENVKIINNGAKALEQSALEMSTSVPDVTPVDYTMEPMNEELIVDLERVKIYAEDPSAQENVKLIDVRSIAEYEEGYIPGAILYPHTKNYYSDDTFKSARDTTIFYQDAGIKKDHEIILYCKSSYRATIVAALLDEAGYENVKVFDGAWIAWENESMPTAEVEEDAPITTSDGS